jgi:hypothetical protein
VSNPGWGDWVRIVHDDDPAKPEEPFRDLAGRCGTYDGFDQRIGVPRPHRVRLSNGIGHFVYVFAVEVITPGQQIRDAEARVAATKEAVLIAAREQHAAARHVVARPSADSPTEARVERLFKAEDGVDDAVGQLIDAERALDALRPIERPASGGSHPWNGGRHTRETADPESAERGVE